jgi:hypothetical protein
MASTPVINGPSISVTVPSGSSVHPFSNVTLTDPNPSATEYFSINFTRSGGSNGTLVGPNLSGRNGSYVISRDNPVNILSELHQIVFTPAPLMAGLSPSTTIMNLYDKSSAGGSPGEFMVTVVETPPPTPQQTAVVALYEGLFNRTPSYNEVQNWSNAISAGTPVAALPQVFLSTAEYQADSNSQFVTSRYQSFLGRTPAPAEVQVWTSALANGASQAQVVTALDDSAEAHARFAAQIAGEDPNSAFVTILYQGLLGHAAPASGVQAWVNVLNSGQSQANVAQAFLSSAEYQSISNSQFVAGLYQSMLGRSAGATEVQGWTGALNSGASRAQVAATIAQTPEAQNHWQSVVLPTS